MLYLPWRKENDELLEIDAELVFNSNIQSILRVKQEFCKVDDETLDGYINQLHEEQQDLDVDDEDDNSNNSSSHYDRENDFNRYTVDVDDSEEGDYHRTNNLDDDLSGTSSRDGNKTYLEKVFLFLTN